MHPGRAFIALLGLATLAFPTQAAPLNQDRIQSPGPPATDASKLTTGYYVQMAGSPTFVKLWHLLLTAMEP